MHLLTLHSFHTARRAILFGTIATLLAASAQADFTLTLLHNNDGESKLLPSVSGGVNFGGAAFLAGLIQSERAAALAAGNKVITVSSGDNQLAGATFQASLDSGTAGNRTFYDALALSEIGYDAIAFGNHDFDFGPGTLSEFIGDTANGKYVASNLNFSGESSLQSHVNSGKIANSVVVNQGGILIGIVAGITPQLPTITSAGAVTVSPVVASIQAAVDDLRNNQGVQHIVFLSHLQGIGDPVQGDKAILAQLRGIDAVVSGGGSENLLTDTATGNKANPQHPVNSVLPTHRNDATFDKYPVANALDADGRSVPIVTTRGDYGYVGRIDLNFNTAGDVTSFTTPLLPGGRSGPIPVIHTQPGVVADPEIQSTVIAPVTTFVNALDATKLDITNGVPALDGRRANVRSFETNVGNLLADSILDAAKDRAAGAGVDSPIISFTNAGGIRNNSLINDGEFTRKDSFDIAPFANFVAIIEDVSPAKLKSVLENAYSQTTLVGGVPNSSSSAFSGRFAQIAGFEVVYDINRPGTTVNSLGNVVTDGSRVLDVILPDGTFGAMDGVKDYVFQGGLLTAPLGFTLDIATIDFLARGGDGYPLADLPFTFIEGFTYQQALQGFVTNDLAGEVSAAKYAGPENRITVVPEPATGGLLAMAAGALLARRRRK